MPPTGFDERPLKKKLQKALGPARYRHVLAVADLAESLARQHGVPPLRARLAGLLHDCARGLNQSANLKILRHYHGRFAPSATRNNPRLWHNPVGVWLAKNRYGVKDARILRAIGLHSTGQTGMSPLDRIIYVADYGEPNRTYRGAAAVRRLARTDLEAAVRRVTLEKVRYLVRHCRDLHPWTLALAKEQGINVKSFSH